MNGKQEQYCIVQSIGSKSTGYCVEVDVMGEEETGVRRLTCISAAILGMPAGFWGRP